MGNKIAPHKIMWKIVDSYYPSRRIAGTHRKETNMYGTHYLYHESVGNRKEHNAFGTQTIRINYVRNKTVPPKCGKLTELQLVWKIVYN